MAQARAFGRPRDIAGKSTVAKSTLVPLEFLAHVKTHPFPVSCSSTTTFVTFTLNASVTNPVFLWNGNDYIRLTTTLSHAWAASATNALIATTGATSSANTPGSAGVKYYYAGAASDGTVQLVPSTAKPSYEEGPYNAGVLGHPGTARTRMWTYVGWNYMHATTPAFHQFTKVGNTYCLSDNAIAGVDTAGGELSVAAVPKHSGVKMGGWVTGQATGNAVVLGGATSQNTAGLLVGGQKISVAGSSTLPAFAGFSDVPVSANGVWAMIDGTATNVNVNVSIVEDVV